MKNLPFNSVLLALLLIVIPFNLMAQGYQDSVLRTEKRLPIINGLRFMTSDIVADPFINTKFDFTLGTGAALDLKTDVRNLQGEVIRTVSGDITYLVGNVSFQYAVNDWLALSAAYGGAGRLGTNAYTLVAAGISFSDGYTLGGKVKLLQTQRSFLAATADYSSTELSLFSIYDYVRKVYETGQIDSTMSLLETEKISRFFINLNYSFAMTDYLGLTAVGGWGIGKIFQETERGNLRAGLGVLVDFLNVDFIEFPIGIMGSVRYNSYSEAGENLNNLFIYGIKLGYTGHKDFDIGLESKYQKVKVNQNNQNLNTVQTEFKIAYYF